MGDWNPAVLTRREREVVALLVKGLSADEVAAALCIERATVYTHRARALVKLELANNVQLALWALRVGF